MFAGIKRFIYRHRRKLIVSTVVVGGIVFATQYAKRKLIEWQERELKEFLERTRRQQHFEKNEQTCNFTILSLMPTLHETINRLLNTDKLLEKLRTGICDKVATWEELKIIAFTRLSSMLYSGVLLVILLRIQVNVIGGYLYKERSTDSTGKSLISKELQEEYLSLSQHYLTKGVDDLCLLIESKVRFVLESESLKKPLSLQDVEHYFWAIQSAINNDPDDPLSSLSKFILPPAKSYNFKGEEGKMMCQLVNETLDIIETNEVKSLATSCINQGFAQIMDKISDYFVPVEKTKAIAIPGPSSRKDIDIIHTNGFVNLNKVTIPMAKVIPIINGLTNAVYTNGTKDSSNLWMQNFIELNNLKVLGANIYESFSSSSI